MGSDSMFGFFTEKTGYLPEHPETRSLRVCTITYTIDYIHYTCTITG